MQLDVILVVFLQLCESTIEGFKPLDWGERLSQGHLFMYHHGCTSNEVQFHDMCRSCARLQGKAFRERTDRILQARAKLTLSLPQLFLLCRRALFSSHGSLEMSVLWKKNEHCLHHPPHPSLHINQERGRN